MKIINTVVIAVLILLNVGQAQFEVDLEDENIFQSIAYFLRYQDDGFDWQTLESDTLRINWYNGDANFGQAALSAAQAGLESIRTLIPLDLVQPIEVFIYANADDLRGTLNPRGEAWVAG